MGSVLAYDILTSMQTCPSPSPMSPSSPAHSPPPAPPTCSVSNDSDASVCPTGEVGRRKFLTTPSSSRKASQNVRKCIIILLFTKNYNNYYRVNKLFCLCTCIYMPAVNDMISCAINLEIIHLVYLPMLQ